jgi:hypothetical protein
MASHRTHLFPARRLFRRKFISPDDAVFSLTVSFATLPRMMPVEWSLRTDEYLFCCDEGVSFGAANRRQTATGPEWSGLLR